MSLIKIRKGIKGFTLVELLIVIVILGILAALILPRLMAQPEKAKIAEAINTMGAVRRAIQTTADSRGLAVNNAALCTGGAVVWNAIGMTNPATGGGSPSFAYTCAASGTDLVLTATRQAVHGEATGANTYIGSAFTLSVNGGTWGIGGTGAGANPYTLVTSQPST